MVLTVLTCCLDSWWPGLVFMAEPTKARRFSVRLPKCCQIHQIQIQQLLLINKLSLRPMDRSMTFWQTFFASDRSKAKATSGRTKMSMQYYTIYAYLCHMPWYAWENHHLWVKLCRCDQAQATCARPSRRRSFQDHLARGWNDKFGR